MQREEPKKIICALYLVAKDSCEYHIEGFGQNPARRSRLPVIAENGMRSVWSNKRLGFTEEGGYVGQREFAHNYSGRIEVGEFCKLSWVIKGSIF